MSWGPSQNEHCLLHWWAEPPVFRQDCHHPRSLINAIQSFIKGIVLHSHDSLCFSTKHTRSVGIPHERLEFRVSAVYTISSVIELVLHVAEVDRLTG